MNDCSLVGVTADRPYIGLDFFSEKDASFFTEREEEVDACADMLLGMNVKFLVLQGTTGAGKSSFLRAGLIPKLKHQSAENIYYLGSEDCVIRCTSDPLLWIAEELSLSISTGQLTMDPSKNCLPTAELREKMPRKDLAGPILATLQAVCERLAGQLVIIIDQAEEVLTQSLDEVQQRDATDGFFYFLKEAYLRNIDFRLVLALRTEYYGRFRDAMHIDDSRLSARPRSGGIQPFLLCPIREHAALIRIIKAPTLSPAFSHDPFEFETAAADKIVKELTKYFPEGSVTPFLQVICKILYEDLPRHHRKITLKQYQKLGDLKGIADLYLKRGIQQVPGPSASDADRAKWLRFLACFTSKQAGGMVVSKIEPLHALKKSAMEQGLGGDIEAAAIKLCANPAPLLRGVPGDRPTHFSLKHDVLAVVLSRWEEDQASKASQLKAKQKKLRKLLGAGICASLAVGIVAGFIYVQNAQFRSLKNIVTDRLAYAANPPRSDYGHSLLISLHALKAIDDGPALYMFPRRELRETTLQQLRGTLLRTPKFFGEYWSADFDPHGRKLVALSGDGRTLSEVFLNSGTSTQQFPEISFLLPEIPAAELDTGLVASGFISGREKVVAVDNQLYRWGFLETTASPSIRLEPYRGGADLYTEYEVKNGALYIIEYFISGSNLDVFGTKLGSEEAADHLKAHLAHISKGTPPPHFSDALASQDFYAYLAPLTDAQDDARKDWRVRDLEGKHDISFQRNPSSDQAVIKNMRFGFIQGDRAAVLQRSEGKFEYVALGGGAEEAAPAKTVAQQVRGEEIIFANGHGPGDPKLTPTVSYTPWVASPIAAVRNGENFRLAWVTKDGIALADGVLHGKMRIRGSDAAAGTLLTGEPNASKLIFSEDGELLFMVQRQFHSRPAKVRVWDLSTEYASHIRKLPDDQLISLACGLLNRISKKLPGSDQATAIEGSQASRFDSAICSDKLTTVE